MIDAMQMDDDATFAKAYGLLAGLGTKATKR